MIDATCFDQFERDVELEIGIDFAEENVRNAISDISRASEANPDLTVRLRLSVIKEKLEGVLREISVARDALGVASVANDTDEELVIA